MAKKTYTKQISTWWSDLDTEADNHRVSVGLFSKNCEEKKIKKSKKCRPDFNNFLNFPSSKSNEIVKNCDIVKQGLKKLQHFLSVSHKNGCSNHKCSYDDSIYKLELTLKDQKDNKNYALPRKRPKKFKLELNEESQTDE